MPISIFRRLHESRLKNLLSRVNATRLSGSTYPRVAVLIGRGRYPQQIVILDLMTLRTLADVRVLLGHLPKKYRAKETWRHVARILDEAAGGGIQPVEVAVAVKLVLSLEGIASRPH